MFKNTLLVAILPLFMACSTSDQPKEDKNPLSTLVTTDIVDMNATKSKEPVSEDLAAADFKAGLSKPGILLIDVRTPEEFAAGTIEGAQNINYLSPTFESEIEKLAKDQPVYVFCQSGGRSGKAKTVLTDKGFDEVYNLIGGYGQWPY